MRTLITELTRFLVEHPDQIRIDESQEGTVTVLRLHVAESDLGRVIGRQGRTARALRKTLAAAQHGRNQYVLDIAEPGEEA